MESINQLLPLGAKVQTALMRCRSLLERNLVKRSEELVYLDQPDKGPPFLGAYGASCATIGLIASGMSGDDELIRNLLAYLSSHQLESGGWTIRNTAPIGLTTACAFSLLAFSFAGIKTELERTTVSRGIEWLTKNARKGGWPFFEGGAETATTPTALAVRALGRLQNYLPASARSVLNQGSDILERTFSADGYIVNGGSASVATTSITIITLLECGFPLFSDQLSKAAQWLKAHKQWEHDASDCFYAHLATQAAGHINSNHLTYHVNYVHFTPALTLQALLACEIDIAEEPIVIDLCNHLLANQTQDGGWLSPLAPRESPTWMTMDGALALSHFARTLLAVRPSLPFRQNIIQIQGEIATFEQRSRESINALKQQVNELESKTTQLVALAPWLRAFKYFMLFIALAVIFSICAALRLTLPSKYHWSMEALGIFLGILSIMATIMPSILARRHKQRDMIDSTSFPARSTPLERERSSSGLTVYEQMDNNSGPKETGRQ